MENIIGQTDEILLRALKEEELDFILTVQKHPENSLFIPQWRKNTHMEAMQDSNYLYLIIENVKEKTNVGYVILSGMENYHKSVELKQIVITEKNKGYGRKALKLVKSFVFNKVKAHRLRLEVRSNNPNAIALYKSEGFFQEGVLRDCVIIGGRYLSVVVMSILENEYYSYEVL